MRILKLNATKTTHSALKLTGTCLLYVIEQHNCAVCQILAPKEAFNKRSAMTPNVPASLFLANSLLSNRHGILLVFHVLTANLRCFSSKFAFI